jgi:hypothetical protein
MKKNYEDFMKLIERDAKKEIPPPNKNYESILKDLYKN